jgi:hypothetical protein
MGVAPFDILHLAPRFPMAGGHRVFGTSVPFLAQLLLYTWLMRMLRSEFLCKPF